MYSVARPERGCHIESVSSLNDTDRREFLREYPPVSYRQPRDGGSWPDYELEPVTESDGLRHLTTPPVDPLVRGSPRLDLKDDGKNCHLWVVDERGLPYILQNPIHRLGPNPLKHTNVTGAGKASLGGELWFDDPSTIYVSGSSGRYPPRDAEQLRRAEALFRSAGYAVMSFGWDEETKRPRKILPPDALTASTSGTKR